MEILPWVEKYRPKEISKIALSEDKKLLLENLIRKKNMPHLLFVGPPGTGKTTTALAIARALYGDNVHSNLLELNASDERGIDTIRERVKEFAMMIPTTDIGFKIIFLDEADALTEEAQQALRRMMENYSKYTRFILSCNDLSAIISPIQSRVAIIRFSALDNQSIKNILYEISEKENLKIDEEALDLITEISEGDLRKAINILQSSSYLSKKITVKEIENITSGVSYKKGLEVLNLVKKDYNKARDKVFDFLNAGFTADDIIKSIYKAVVSENYSLEERIKYLKLLAEYEYRISLGSNPKMQLDALLSELSK
jgi:replication factor C small subunit